VRPAPPLRHTQEHLCEIGIAQQALREDNEEMSKAIKKQEEQIAGLRKSCYSMDKSIKKLKKDSASQKKKITEKNL